MELDRNLWVGWCLEHLTMLIMKADTLIMSSSEENLRSLRSPAVSSRSSSTHNDSIRFNFQKHQLRLFHNCLMVIVCGNMKGVILRGSAQGTDREHRASEVRDRCENIITVHRQHHHLNIISTSSHEDDDDPRRPCYHQHYHIHALPVQFPPWGKFVSNDYVGNMPMTNPTIDNDNDDWWICWIYIGICLDITVNRWRSHHTMVGSCYHGGNVLEGLIHHHPPLVLSSLHHHHQHQNHHSLVRQAARAQGSLCQFSGALFPKTSPQAKRHKPSLPKLF